MPFLFSVITILCKIVIFLIQVDSNELYVIGYTLFSCLHFQPLQALYMFKSRTARRETAFKEYRGYGFATRSLVEIDDSLKIVHPVNSAR